MSHTPPDPAPSEDSSDWLTRARHIFFGTAATFVEMIEDPEKREENWNKMSMDINELAQELAVKGQMTEAEALRQIQEQQRQHQSPQNPQAPPQDPHPQSSPPASESPSEPRSAATSSEPSSSTAPPIGSQRSTPPPPPDPEPPAPPKGEPVSVDDISALMDLTREVERLRRDLEDRRTSHADSDPKSSS